MIFILTVSLLWGLLLCFFVLSPLWSKKQVKFQYSMKNKKKYIRSLMVLKKNLLDKLAFGKCDDEKISNMSKEIAMKTLLEVIEKLEDVGHNLVQNNENNINSKDLGKESGAIHFSILILISFFVGICLSQLHVCASELNQDQSIPNSVTIPQATFISSRNAYLPSVNQFILSPDQGILHVYYVGMFSNSTALKQGRVIFPFPKNIQNVSLHSDNKAVLETSQDHPGDDIIIFTPMNLKVNQFQAEFSLKADDGMVDWSKNTITNLPGVLLFIMPHYNGVVRDMLSHFFKNVNVWPSRLVNISSDFQSMISSDVLKADTKSTQGVLSHQWIRVGNSQSPYPEFKVIGLVPSRIYLYYLVGFFGFILICSIATFFIKRS